MNVTADANAGARQAKVWLTHFAWSWQGALRVLQIGGDANLAQESLDAEHGAELGVEHLERDETVVLEITREVHRGHAAATELALDRVAARQCVAEGCGHVHAQEVAATQARAEG